MIAIEKLRREIRYAGLNRFSITKIRGILGEKLSLLIGYTLPFDIIKKRLSFKPLMAGFALTNICNANCIFCGFQYITTEKGIMDFNVFKKGINDFNYIGGGDISLTPPLGEPLIDTGLIDKIKYARSFKNIGRIGMYTNGILLNQFSFRGILTSGITDINISIGGFNRETYNRIFRVDRFEQVANNIFNLGKINQEIGKPVRLFLSLRCDRPLIDFFKSPFYKKIRGFIDTIDYQYNFDSWSGRIKEADLFYPMKLRKLKILKDPCAMFYASLTILWNGDVTLCGCRELNGDSQLILGNIMEHSLLSMWRSKKIIDLRRKFSEGKIPDICKECAHYNSFRTYRRWLFYRKAKDNYNAFCHSDYKKVGNG